MSDYWSDENLGSTIILSREKDGVIERVHMNVFKDDTVSSSGTTTQRRYGTTTQAVSDEINVSVSVTPIVTYNAENAFVFDLQATEKISFSFTRKNPTGIIHVMNNNVMTEMPLPWDASSDDRHWSNRTWMNKLRNFIDCWQTDSDGCKLTYEPLDDTLQAAIPSLNVYVQTLQYNMNTSSNEVVNGTLTLQVGSMTADAADASDSNVQIAGYNDPIDFKDMTIIMSSSDGLAKYILYCKGKEDASGNIVDLNCVTEYHLKGGPEQPFEYLKMSISKKRLSVVAPNLMNDIIAGRNRIELDAMGTGQFIVTKCSSTSTTYTITAYSIYEIYRSLPVNNRILFGNGVNTTPYNVIFRILSTRNTVGTGSDISPVYFTQDNIRYAFFNKNNVWSVAHQYAFSNDASAWYVMSVCALRLNCKIWFSDNYAYIVDTSITEDMLASPRGYGITTNMGGYSSHISKLYLNTSDPYPLFATDTERNFSKSVCDMISLGDEGAETICNSVRIQFNKSLDDRDVDELTRGGYASGVTATGLTSILNTVTNVSAYQPDVTPYPLIAQSQSKYGIKETVYKIPEIGDEDADAIAVNVANSYCDGEQSVGFKLKEAHKDVNNNIVNKHWQKYFPTFTQVDEIYDYSNDLVLSNMSNFLCTETSEFTITNLNCYSDHTFYVPKRTIFRIFATKTSLSVSGIKDIVVYDANDQDITSETSISIVNSYTFSGKTVYSIDIVVERPCYLNMYSYPVSVSLKKIIFNLKDSRVEMPNKLCLSTFEHHFPEGTTTYWFGIMKPTDITQNTSEIHNAMYNQ